MPNRSPLRQPLAQGHAQDLRRDPAPAETLLWSLLRDRRLAGLKFRRQHPIGPFIADFYCHAKKLVVELDGETHELRLDFDALRSDYIEQQGLRVFRVRNDDVWSNLEGVGIALLRFLEIDPQPWLNGAYRKAA